MRLADHFADTPGHYPQFCRWCQECPDDCEHSDCVLEREERAIDAREQNDLDDYMEGGW